MYIVLVTRVWVYYPCYTCLCILSLLRVFVYIVLVMHVCVYCPCYACLCILSLLSVCVIILVKCLCILSLLRVFVYTVLVMRVCVYCPCYACLCILSLCRFKWLEWLKAKRHRSHLYGFSLVWLLMCRFRLPFCVNPFKQNEQRYGFRPTWASMWHLSAELRDNTLPHKWHVNLVRDGVTFWWMYILESGTECSLVHSTSGKHK